MNAKERKQYEKYISLMVQRINDGKLTIDSFEGQVRIDIERRIGSRIKPLFKIWTNPTTGEIRVYANNIGEKNDEKVYAVKIEEIPSAGIMDAFEIKIQNKFQSYDSSRKAMLTEWFARAAGTSSWKELMVKSAK